MQDRIKLGNRVKDSITGFSGIVTGRNEWLYGCEQVLIQPDKLKDGAPVKADWFDEQRVILLSAKKPPGAKKSKVVTGGPQRGPDKPSGRM